MKQTFRVCVCVAVCLLASGVAGVEDPAVEVVESRYPSGKLKTKSHVYKDASGKTIRHGLFTLFHENGRKKMEGNFKHGEFDGPLKRWYASGQLLAHVVEDGRKGFEKTWYPSGAKQREASYDGPKFEAREWYPDGAKKEVTVTEGGKGTQSLWYPNGAKRSVAQLSKSTPDGETACWDCQGRPLAKGTYRGGQRWKGTFARWAGDGAMAVIETIEEGRVTGKLHVVPRYDPKTDRARVVKGQTAVDPTYGFTAANPVKVGGRTLLGWGPCPRAARDYLRHLRTAGLTPFDFKRVGYAIGGREFEAGTVPATPAGLPAMKKGEYPVDKYLLISRDGKKKHFLYIDSRHPDRPASKVNAPKGLLFVRAEGESTTRPAATN